MKKISIRALYASPLVVVRLLLFFFLLTYTHHVCAAIRYVRATQYGTGDGSNWGNASKELQAIINASASGDEVWVAGGNYQRANSGEYFSMKEGVKIYGGFAGNEESLTSRDLTIIANASIMKGNGNAVIKNSYNQLTPLAVLDGFTITGSPGSGVVNVNVSPTIRNCSIINNTAVFGGGMNNYASSPVLINCSISGNTASSDGGGIHNDYSSPTLINCSITGNHALRKGGGMDNLVSSYPIVTNCIVSGNSAPDGGGLYTLANSSPILTNCTIADNNATNDGGGLYNDGFSPKLRNCIVYGNSSGIFNKGVVPETYYSLVQGITSTSNNNISGGTDPLFADAANGNYRLQVCSPVINKGSNTYYGTGQNPNLTAITTDLAAKPRFYNSGTVDMGAYELEYSTAIRYVKEGGTGSGTSWDCPTGDLQAAINSANSGDQVWVAGGTYQGAFSMKEAVKIYGGFTGDETTLTQRDLRNTANASILTGGIYVIDNYENGLTADAVLDGFTITGGTKSGVRNRLTSPTIINCSIKGNSSGNSGEYGGGFFNDGSSPTITNCSINGNRARFGGGGMANINSSSPILTNCTIGGNQAADNSGAIYNESSSSPVIRNSIVYGNTGGIRNYDSNPEITYSLVQGMTSTNDGNISGDTDPLFVDAANGNYRLQTCSPVLNKGSNGYYAEIRGQFPDLSHITTDLDGKLRFYNSGTVDMGAYEFAGSSSELAGDKDVVTTTIDGDIFLLANGSGCKVIAYLTPNGGAPVSGEIKAKVWVETTQSAKFVKRHYQITPTTGAETATAKVTLYFTQQEFTDFNFANSTKLPINAEDTQNYKANLRIEKRAGKSKNDDSGLPETYDGAVVTINPLDPAVNGSITWNTYASRWEVSFDVKGFSGFFVKTTETALPLNLLSFTGTKEKGANLLNWKTASEINTMNFEVQRSMDAKTFTKIGTVDANGSGNHQYSYKDTTTYYGNIYYRLKMNDSDGTFAYSKIISLSNGEVSPAIVYPNPAIESITLTVPPTLIQSEATLYDVTGRPLQSITINANKQQISIKSLRSGVYILKFADGSSERFVKE